MYNYTNLNPYEIRTIDLSFQVSGAIIGDILVFNAQINPVTGDATTYDNNIAFAQIVSSALSNRSSNNTSNANDTNDVLVIEGNEIEIDKADEYLHYVIRFQNTDSNTAANVIITTELSDKLDWNTIKIEKLSHNGKVFILNENQVTFNFENINLPDGASNEAGSHGYIAYKIKPKASVSIGDIISSQSTIYFNNTSITTNMASTLITAVAGVENNQLTNVTIFPNPSKDIINISSPSDTIKSIEIFDTLGRLVLRKEKNNGINKIDISILDKNVYLLKITDDNGNSKIKKILKN